MNLQFLPNPIQVRPEYRDITLNETLRVPLWELVFHDAVVVSSRWDYTPNRFTDKRDWDKETLFYLLNGDMPTFLTDRADFRANKDRFVRASRTVGKWNEQTGFEEMTDHRWLAPEGRVQQATYESGKRVVVNFGPGEFRLPDGKVVPDQGYVTYP